MYTVGQKCHFFNYLRETIADFNNYRHATSKKRDANDYSFGHLTLILSLHYFVKCKNPSFAINNNEFILGSACVGPKYH